MSLFWIHCASCLPVIAFAACAGSKQPPAAPGAATTASAAAESSADAIDALVARLSEQPLWTNGLSPEVELDATDPIEEVLKQVFAAISFDQGRVTSHRVMETRRVSIGAEAAPYTAVLLETNLGRKIALLRHEGAAVGWWSRVFDAAGE